MNENKKMSVFDYILAVLFGGVTVVLALQVVMRYVFNNSLVWSEEISRFVFTWIILLGAALALKEGTHIRIDFLTEKLSPNIQRFLNYFNNVLLLGFVVLMIPMGIKLVHVTKNTSSAALGLPMDYVFYGALPVFAVIATYFAVCNLISMFRQNKQ
ncbi:TRAP transporter small permease [Petroclostridium sp. X23]|uniref:TRAP transporter small permease n=1 Tax=Petroclostridium sp. X23 TaxID=3045146 RepID=UPI0024AD8B09|nr:TRAP transporter small permease [Petroclostridium sp. X23]WHH57141.1 TRAP transporter small permease [Petroclostridium sp. X23]